MEYPVKQMETDPHGKNAKEPGAKLDAGKVSIYQGLVDYFPRAVRAVAQLSTFGAQKYSWKGWETVPNGYERYKNAQLRHEMDKVIEGPVDRAWLEQGQYVLHDTAVAWNALAALELYLRSLEEAPMPPPPPPPAPLNMPPKAEKDLTSIPQEEKKPPRLNVGDQVMWNCSYGKPFPLTGAKGTVCGVSGMEIQVEWDLYPRALHRLFYSEIDCLKKL